VSRGTPPGKAPAAAGAAEVAYRHLSAAAGDHPPVEDVLAAAAGD
jgi:hypothetical protein